MSWASNLLRRGRGGAKAAPARHAPATPPPPPPPSAPEPKLTVEQARELFSEGVARAEAGEAERARAIFERIEDGDPYGDWAAFRIGLLDREGGDETAAEAAFTRAIALNPELFWAHYERLRLPSVRGDRGRRDRYVEALLDIGWETLSPAHVGEIETSAAAVWRDGKRDLAGRLLARVFPSEALGAESLARIVETALDPELIEAASARRAALVGARGRAPAMPDAPAGEQSAFDAAVADFEAGRLAPAAAAFETLTGSPKLAGWVHFYLGRIYSDEADQSRALHAFDAAVAAEPTLFWAHFERTVLGSSLGVPDLRLSNYVARLHDVPWEPLQPQHVRELEKVGHALWERGDRDAGARLLSRLWPSTELSPYALVRIVEMGVDRDVQRQAADLLHGRTDLDGTALRVLSEYHQRHGQGDRAIASRERAFELKSYDFETWVGLVRTYAGNGERERAFATIAQADQFTEKQRQYATLVAQVELGDIDDGFQSFRSYCRLHGEVPKYTGIRTAYRLADMFDVARRDEVVGLLTAHHPDDRDVALVLINAAMRDQRWADARAAFEAKFGDGADTGQDVRLARIDVLAFSGELDEAAKLLEAERVDGVLPPAFLRSNIRILSEMERWPEVLETGLAQLGDEVSFPQFLSVLVRAARKLDASERLLDALLALPRPLAPERLAAIHAVAEDLAEQGRDVLARLDGIDLPFERRHRIALKLRTQAAPAPVEKDLCVYYCADEAYLTPALVSLTSLAMSNVGVARRAIFYLVVDADALERAEAASAALGQRLGLAIEVVDAATVVASTEGLRTGYGLFTGGQQLALAAYYRIFFARWLVEQKRFGQALYVDADTIVRSGLEELFAVEHHAPIMARRDDDRPEVRHATELHGLQGAYFNSGILRFALDHPELPALLDRAIAAATDPAVELIFQDQCALNIAFDTRVADLPDKFNAFTPPSVSGDGISVAEAVIVHFLDRPKPWDSLYRHPAREWFEWFDLVETLRQETTSGA